MNKPRFILYIVIAAWILCGCSDRDIQLCYKEGYSHYIKGEVEQAVPCYVQCIKYSKSNNYRFAASAYQDIASICHLEGNHKMAYEMNERSVDYYGRAGLKQEQNISLCRSAVYKAYLGNKDEAVTQLRHIKAISQDTATQEVASEYEQFLQKGMLPVMNDSIGAVSASDLYNAVAVIKYELYKKPFAMKMMLCVLLFMVASLGIYTTHSGMLKHLFDIRKEREVYNQQYTDDINNYCGYLRTHPEELKKELHWGNYTKMCSVVNMRFGNVINKLQKCAALNETEIKLCVLVLIDFPRNQIAEILPYAPNSVGKLKNTVAKKLQTNGKNLHDLLIEMVLKKDNLLS